MRSAAVCFGTLDTLRRLAGTIQRFIRETPAACLRIFDINLRTPYWSADVVLESLELAAILKLNDAELPVIRDLFSLAAVDRHVLQQLCERFSLSLVALTRGAAGSLLVARTGECSDLSGSSVAVVDTVGAGHAFTACIVVGLLDGLSLATIHDWGVARGVLRLHAERSDPADSGLLLRRP